MPPRVPRSRTSPASPGVSRGAVSFALNDRPGVADATRARILAVAAELGFTPSHRARALSSSRALAVGLVIARQPETLSADPFFPAFIAGIEKTLAERGQALLLQVVPDQESERRSYENLAASGRVDGVFLTDLRVDDPRPDAAGVPRPADRRDRSRPDRRAAGPWWPWTTAPASSAAVEHLVALGHRRIAHVAGPVEFVHSRSRQTAWAEALAAAGLEESPLCLVRLLAVRRRAGHPASCSTSPSRRPPSCTPTT